jgi:hypothetical protein
MPHLSASQLVLLLGCPRQWRYAYVEGIKQPRTADLVVGVVVHAGVEAWQATRTPGVEPRARGDPDLLAVRRALRETWRWETGPLLPPEPPERPEPRPREPGDTIDWKGLPEVEAKRLIWRLVVGYVGSEAARATRPAAVERVFSVPIPGCPEWTLDGRYDLVELDGTIRDLKTAKGLTFWTAEAAGFAGEKGLQATCYAWARREETGEIPPAVAFDVVVKPRRPGDPVRVETVETTRTAAELDWFGRVQLPALVRQVEADALGPNPLYKWCGWCPAAWRRRCMPWRAEERR